MDSDLVIKDSNSVLRAWHYFYTNKKTHGYDYFYTWLHVTQGVVRIHGSKNISVNDGSITIPITIPTSLTFSNEQYMMMFILRWK